MLAPLAAKPPLTHAGHRPGTFPLVLLRLIPGPGTRQATLQRLFRSASCLRSTLKLRVSPARACSINHRHHPRGD